MRKSIPIPTSTPRLSLREYLLERADLHARPEMRHAFARHCERINALKRPRAEFDSLFLDFTRA